MSYGAPEFILSGVVVLPHGGGGGRGVISLPCYRIAVILPYLAFHSTAWPQV